MAHCLEIVEIRWAFSTFASLRAFLNDFLPFMQIFCLLGTNGTRSAKEMRSANA